MGQPQRRKKHHSGDTHLQRRWRTRSRKRDLDQVINSRGKWNYFKPKNLPSQIDKDIQEKPVELINQEVDLDKPGFAQFYCIHCAKYFIDDTAMQAHFRTKVSHSG